MVDSQEGTRELAVTKVDALLELWRTRMLRPVFWTASLFCTATVGLFAIQLSSHGSWQPSAWAALMLAVLWYATLSNRRSVHTRNGLIVLATGAEEKVLTAVASVPALVDDDAFGLESVLAAVAAAWSLGVPPDLIRAGIEGFEPQPMLAPSEAEAAVA